MVPRLLAACRLSKAEVTSFPHPPAEPGLLQMVRHGELIVTLTTTNLCSIHLHSLTTSQTGGSIKN